MLEEGATRRLTRRQLLRGAGGAGGAAALGGGAYGASRLLAHASRTPRRAPTVDPPGPVHAFRSRPDLRPAAVAVAGPVAESAYLFIGPGSLHGSQSGPLITDGDGEPVWFRPLRGHQWAANFTAASYDGQPVLTWWEGELQQPIGYGRGEAVVLDSSYRKLFRIRAARGRIMDVHELLLTPQGTALFTCYPETVTTDLSEIGGPRRGRVLQSVIQEVDIRSGRPVMEWRSLEHIPISESYRPFEDPYDYLHANSIDITPDGHLLVSCRHTWSIYKLDRITGRVMWRLGGKRSDFVMGGGAQFAWQHHAKQVGGRTLTVFDDGSDGKTKTERQSRGLVLGFDEVGRRAWLEGAYTHPKGLSAAAMGSVQLLPDGHVLVGWGSQPHVTEFAADGTLVNDAAMTTGQQTYRAFRVPWHGSPRHRPAIAAHGDRRTAGRTVYASWNGSTNVTHWRVEAGARASDLAPLGVVHRAGFETTIALGADPRYAAVTALDGGGQALGRSATLKL